MLVKTMLLISKALVNSSGYGAKKATWSNRCTEEIAKGWYIPPTLGFVLMMHKCYIFPCSFRRAMEAEKCLGEASQSLWVLLETNTESQPISGAAAQQPCPIHGPKKLKLCKGEGLLTVARHNYPSEQLIWITRLLFGRALVRLFSLH